MRFLPLSLFGTFPPRFPFGFQCYVWPFCVVVVQFSHFSCSHIFSFPLSPFPFPLSPFPFPFPKVYFSLATFAAHPFSPLPRCGAQSGFYFCVAMFVIVTGAVCCQQQVCNCFPNGGGGGGVVFSVFCGAFFPWGGGWKAPDSGEGGWVGQGGGGSCEEFGVDNGKGGGDLGIVSPNFL